MRQPSSLQNICHQRQFFLLPNGKKLAYIDFGPKQGEPVLLLHGAHGSATYFSHLPGYPYGSHWRMISVDRPGYGESDMWRYSYRELANALELLCRYLHLEHISVVGFSAGGAFALACGAVFPALIHQIVAIATTSPLTPQTLVQVNRTNRFCYWLARNLPFVSRANANFIAWVCRYRMANFLELFKHKFPPADQREFDKEIVRQMLITSLKEAYPHGHGDGLAQDLENQVKAWDFNPCKVVTETHLWASEDDTIAPLAMAQHLYDQIPNSYLHLVSDAGHLWHICHMQQILEQSLCSL